MFAFPAMMKGSVYVPPVPTGNIWTANFNTNSVSKFTPLGIPTTYAISQSGPTGIAFDGINMWTINRTAGTITKVSPIGIPVSYGPLDFPEAIAFDGVNMWTLNRGDSSVAKITPAGVITIYPGLPSGGYGIAFDGTNMWTANGSSNSVSKITPAGVITTYSGVTGFPVCIAFDGTNMWTTNGDNSGIICKITPTGTVTQYSGLGAGILVGLYISTPSQSYGIAFDGVNIWTANLNSTVSKITSDGVITNYTCGAYGTYGMAFDGVNMWTSDPGNLYIYKVKPDGTRDIYTGTQGKALAYDGYLLSHWWGGS